jgi:hypothetical protein
MIMIYATKQTYPVIKREKHFRKCSINRIHYNIYKQFDYFAMVMESLEKIAKEQKRKKLQQKTIFNYEIKEP